MSISIYNNVWESIFDAYEKVIRKHGVRKLAIGYNGKRLTPWADSVLVVSNEYFYTQNFDKQVITLYKYDNSNSKLSIIKNIRDSLEYADSNYYVTSNLRNNIKVYSYPDTLLHDINYDFNEIIEPSVSLFSLYPLILEISGKDRLERLILIDKNEVKSTLKLKSPLSLFSQGDFIVARDLYYVSFYDIKTLKHFKTIYGDCEILYNFMERNGWDHKTGNMKGVLEKILSIELDEVNVKDLL